MDIMTTEQYNHWRSVTDAQKVRLAKEIAGFKQNCLMKYVREGHSEDLDQYIDKMAIEFAEVTVKVQMGLNLMEETLANVEIDDHVY